MVEIPRQIASMIPTDVLNYVNGLKENKLYSGMIIFFIGNLIVSQLSTTGAFEVNVNGIIYIFFRNFFEIIFFGNREFCIKFGQRIFLVYFFRCL